LTDNRQDPHKVSFFFLTCHAFAWRSISDDGVPIENNQAIYKDIGFLVHAKSIIAMIDTCIGMMGPDMEPVSQ